MRSAGWVTSSLIAVFAIAIAIPTAAPPTAQARDVDCGDFSSQAAAQNVLNQDSSDPNGLDADGDGIACESNPCPCSTSSGGGGGGGNGGNGGGNTPEPPPPPKPHDQYIRAKIIQVLDGSLVRVRAYGSTGRKRYFVDLIGLDTPRKSECGGREAKKALRQIGHPGTRVTSVAVSSTPT